MNRYRSGGPSKATATTLCQKCLKRGHYTYECTAAQQERPYVSRPSRSQQLLNPKLAPKLSAPTPPAPEAKKVITTKEESSSRTRASPELSESRRMSRSPSLSSHSSHSSNSVATISTSRSRSRSLRDDDTARRQDRNETTRRGSQQRPGSSADLHRRSPSSSSSLQPREGVDVIVNRSGRDRLTRGLRSRSPERSPPRRNVSHCPRSRSRSRSPYRGAGDRRRSPVAVNNGRGEDSGRGARQRSLSPYSRRTALT